MANRCSICSRHAVFLRAPVMFFETSFALIFSELFYSAIEIDLYSLYRRKVTAAFELKT